ncbi:MAG: DUF2075 domain-containing protein [Anaerolineaceae bacterium]|nr:MAG: DUF2075 domain-containing protein [Anaerolineaceae bacterium]
MTIPSQNDFLLPFLNLLGDGETLTRSQMLFRLTKHFGISEADAQAMSGNQFTLVSRVAWCDIHFVKAGFVEKRQHPTDSMQDEFRITSLGIRELQKRADSITVGYLQGFYRGNVHRGAGSDDTTSDAELALYEAFDKLPGPFKVLHAVKWFARDRGTVGEVDFLIAHPGHGVLVLEVKGGDIRIERGQWYSTDRNGRTHSIKDPCEQAERNRRALADWLSHDPRSRRVPFALFPAVALPDSQVAGHIRPDCPQDIFIDTTHLHDLEARILQIFAYWQSRADDSNASMGGSQAVSALIDLLIPTRQLQPTIAEVFERERRKIDELTREQFRVLRQLKHHRKAAIIGGAGTGKTLLAMEKAAQLAESGMRVLLLFYNRPLADWVAGQLRSAGYGEEVIVATTFHSMVGYLVNQAGIRSDYSWREFTEQAPEILLDALEIIRAPDSDKKHLLFDAVLVDEAQDFEDTWWIGLLDALKEPETGVFYVFFDDNQRIYTQISDIPMGATPLYLYENCRNTRHIHAALMPYTEDQDIECIGPEGRPVQVMPAKNHQAARKALQQVLYQLVNEDGIAIEDIIILTPAGEKRSKWKSDDQLGNFILTWDLQTEMPLAGRISTIQRFKGLERAVVILTELHALREEIASQLLYVGLSRARHHVVVIGDLPQN